MALTVLLFALFASIFTISKTGLNYTEPFFFVGSRMLLAGVIMLACEFVLQKGRLNLRGKRVKNVLLLAIFNIYLTNTFEFWGLKYLTSSKTCFIYSLSPFLSALFSYFIFSEVMTRKKWVGLIIGFVGLFPVLFYQTQQEADAGRFLLLSWPEISVILAATCSVYGWILLRQCIREDGYSPFTANGISMLIGGGIALFHSFLVENWNPVPVSSYLPFLQCSILLILFSNFICYNLYGYLLKRFSATFMSFAGFMTPIFTALFGWFFLGETVGVPFYISLFVILIGLSIFYFEELEKEYAKPIEETPQ